MATLLPPEAVFDKLASMLSDKLPMLIEVYRQDVRDGWPPIVIYRNILVSLRHTNPKRYPQAQALLEEQIRLLESAPQ